MSKASEKERALHQRISEGDSLALSQLYNDEGEEVVRVLKIKFNKVAQRDVGMILDAVNQAFLSYVQKPEAFNPELKSLKQYLVMAAEGDLLNIMDREKKHDQNRKNISFDVELEEDFWNNIVRNEVNPENELVQHEVINKIERLLQEHFSNETDVEMAKMILRNDKKTDEFSKLLNIEHLSPEEQAAEVKRHKDRIKKVISRHDLLTKIKRVYER